jgi:hypothetical protein
MNAPLTPGQIKDLNTPDYVKNARLIAWVGDMVALCKPDHVHWWMVEAAPSSSSTRAKRPNSYLARSDPVRRGPRRGPHLHLLRQQGRRRPHQQLGRPGRDARR